MNLQLFVSDKGRAALWSYTVDLPRFGDVSLSPESTQLSPEGVAPSPSVSSASIMRSTPVRQLSLQPARHFTPAASALTTTSSWGCGQTKLRSTYRPFVKMAIARSGTRGVTAQLVLDNSLESQLGVAVRLGSGGSGFQTGGRETKTSDWVDTFRPVSNKMRQYETTWVYGEFVQRMCDRQKRTLYHVSTIRPIEQRGDMKTTLPGRYSTPYCIRTVPGQSTTVQKARAVEWSDGVQLRAVSDIGLDLSSQTGHSASGKLNFAWRKDRRGKLCGQFDYPRRNESDGVMVGSLAAR